MKLGLDVVDVERFRGLMERSPNFTGRYFTQAERDYCDSTADPPLRFAGTFAAKEAVMKAMNLTPSPAWAHRIEITRASNGAPSARADGHNVTISISHDGGVAVAVAMISPPESDKANSA